MAITLVVEDTIDLLPVECVCQECGKRWKVTELKDFRRKNLYSGLDGLPSDDIFINCPACKDYAFPPEEVKKGLMKAYEQWKFL